MALDLIEIKPEIAARSSGPTASLGLGYDRVTGALLSSSALTFSETAGGSLIECNVSVCEGLSEVGSALKVDQSLSVGYAGLAEVDQKMEFVSTQKTTQHSLSVVVYARHEQGSKTLKNPKFDVTLNEQDVVDFVRAYGDSYVNSIAEGGEYYAVYTFHTETRESQQSLKASLKAKGIVSGVSASASVSMTLDTFHKETKTSSRFDQKLSGIAHAKLPSQENCIAYALGFSSLELDAPVIIGKTTAPYERLPGFKIPFSDIARNRRYFVGATIDGGLTGTLVKVVALENKLNWLGEIYTCYKYTDEALDAFATVVEADKAAITDQFAAYADDPTQIFVKPVLPSLVKGTPMLSFRKGLGDKWGGDGGQPFGIGSVEDALKMQFRIHSITISGWDYFDRLAICYRDAVHGVEAERVYGGSNDHPQAPMVMNKGEFPVKFKGRAGSVIDRIEIETDADASTSVGSRATGNAFEWTAPTGAVVIGVQGRADPNRHINQFQAVWAYLQPATYERQRN